MLKKLSQALIVGGAIMAALPVAAHHSTAAFDMTKSVNIEGTVKSFQWSNPHSYIQVVVPNAAGGTSEWAIEAGAPELGLRMGWTKGTVKPGDKVKMVVIPLKTGAPGQGVLKSCLLPNGKTLYGPGYRPNVQGGPGGPPPGPAPS